MNEGQRKFLITRTEIENVPSHAFLEEVRLRKNFEIVLDILVGPHIALSGFTKQTMYIGGEKNEIPEQRCDFASRKYENARRHRDNLTCEMLEKMSPYPHWARIKRRIIIV